MSWNVLPDDTLLVNKILTYIHCSQLPNKYSLINELELILKLNKPQLLCKFLKRG